MPNSFFRGVIPFECGKICAKHKNALQVKGEKVQLLARYLGVTVSELLGEDASETAQGPAQPYLVMRYNQLSQEGQEKVMAFVEFTALQEKQAKKEDE